MKKRTKKLVPLMPILVRLGACAKARRWVKRRNFATFAEAWNAAHQSHWLVWLIGKAMDAQAGRLDGLEIPSVESLDEIERSCGWVAVSHHDPEEEKSLRLFCSAARVERALYDFAVREGLVP